MLRVALLATACLLTTTSARAQPKKSDADTLFADGQRLMDAKKFDEACDKFVASLQLEPALGTRLNLADCREHQGRLAEAYDLYVEVVVEATRGGKQTHLAYARQHVDLLAPKLVRVTFAVAEPQLAGLVVKLGDKVLAPADLARVIAVMPGAIAVSASAPDRDPFEVSRDAKAGDQITIDVPALVVHKGVVPPAPASKRPEPARSLTPLIVGGSGAAVVLTSILFGLHAKSVYDDGSSQTAPMGNSKIHTAVEEANVATAMFVVGAVAIGVGTYLYINDRQAQIVPSASEHGAGVALVGAW
jgi:hypothetical protein